MEDSNSETEQGPKIRLPDPRPRATRGGPRRCRLSLQAEVVTPILGGGYRTRHLDDVEVIRPATLKGHLRFWWRALEAQRFDSARELCREESRLWGAVSTANQRSQVDVCVTVHTIGQIDTSPIELSRTLGAYALWPARAETRTRTPIAPRRRPGTRFTLVLEAPTSYENTLIDVLRAWVLFGGYGSRTRRGLGSLTAVQERENWLPTQAHPDALAQLFGRNLLRAAGIRPCDTPTLAGAGFHAAPPVDSPERAWVRALDWLREFRQGTSDPQGQRAREPGVGRPSVSNWPEADKIRNLSRPIRGLPWAHTPRLNSTPAWPRAGFGLPIVGQFQQQSREQGPDGRFLWWKDLTSPRTEPGPFEIRWSGGDRLASPLILKALPLADGRFAPCALWLSRAYPSGEVILRDIPNSGAPFDRLSAPGDPSLFSPLDGANSLREAFFAWVEGR